LFVRRKNKKRIGTKVLETAFAEIRRFEYPFGGLKKAAVPLLRRTCGRFAPGPFVPGQFVPRKKECIVI
jgi:hypothetical protein